MSPFVRGFLSVFNPSILKRPSEIRKQAQSGLSDAQKLFVFDETLDALKLMALQFLTDDEDGEVFKIRRNMAAEERCIQILYAIGEIETDDGIHFRWRRNEK